MTPEQVDVVVVGSVNVDLVASVMRLPQPGETVSAVRYDEFVGGKGSNQAIAAARLGRAVAFVGLVGDDREGSTVREALRDETVDVRWLGTQVGARTGRAVVLVDAGAENSIVVVAGANGHLSAHHIDAAATLLSEASVVVSQLEVQLEAVTAAARATVGTFVLNAAPARELPDALLGLVDVLVVNELEYEAVIGSSLPQRFSDVAAQLRRRSPLPALVVTLGAAGALVWHDNQLTHLPAPTVTVVDTTGAGDTFVGALADALSRGEALLEAARWAVQAASVAVGALGATTGMPQRADVVAALAKATGPADTAPISPSRSAQEVATVD